MTLMVEGNLKQVKFVGGILEVQDPAIRAALESHPNFGFIVYPVGVKHGEVTQAQESSGSSEVADTGPKPIPKEAKARRKSTKGQHKKVAETKADQTAITELMEKK
jgi:hypothetical protein